MTYAEPVVIVDYDPAWPARFEAEAARLRQALGPLAQRIDHVGSTSVPGLAAKPVIDMQISVKPLLLPPAEGLVSQAEDPVSQKEGRSLQNRALSSFPGTPGEPIAEPAYGSWRPVLEGLGYSYFHDPDSEDYPFFCRPPDWPHACHLHVCEAGSYHERRHLAFRDALRADPALAAEYAELKRRLARKHSAATHDSRNAYAEAKSEFINAAVEKVLGGRR